jgi:hypothetical protein
MPTGRWIEIDPLNHNLGFPSCFIPDSARSESIALIDIAGFETSAKPLDSLL